MPDVDDPAWWRRSPHAVYRSGVGSLQDRAVSRCGRPTFGRLCHGMLHLPVRHLWMPVECWFGVRVVFPLCLVQAPTQTKKYPPLPIRIWLPCFDTPFVRDESQVTGESPCTAVVRTDRSETCRVCVDGAENTETPGIQERGTIVFVLLSLCCRSAEPAEQCGVVRGAAGFWGW